MGLFLKGMLVRMMITDNYVTCTRKNRDKVKANTIIIATNAIEEQSKLLAR